MTINKLVDGENLTIEVEGRLDTTTAPELEKVANESLADIKELTIDLKKLEYISSAGLRVVLSMQKKMNTQGSMIVTNPNEEIMEIFDVTGFTDILNIK